MDGGLTSGAYESLRTQELEEQLLRLEGLKPQFHALDPGEAPEVLARHVARVLRRTLAAESDPAHRAALVGEVLERLGAANERPTSTLEQLFALVIAEGPGSQRLLRPITPLSNAA